MPPINGAATAGVIAVSVAVAAAIAVYESPELQRMANDLRRRIAIALHAFGDSISPQERENLFNRPEDAEGFLESRGLGAGSVPDVEADPESLQRQREELMYWNAVRESMKEKAREDAERSEKTRPRASTRGSSFDDFLRRDENAEQGAFVFQSSHEAQNSDGLIRRRGADGMRGLNHSIYTNPFADEHGIDDDIAFENSLMDPEKDEIASDIYSATDLGVNEPRRTATQQAITPAIPTLIRVEEPTPEYSHTGYEPQQIQPQPQSQSQSNPERSERELGPDEYMTAGQEPQDNHDAYSSIQAWAQGASHNASFYSPLPVSPAPASEAELISDGDLTPTDSASLAGSGEDIADEAVSTRSYDVMSDDESMMTPASWTEVGSVVSENESGAIHA
ncbi:hypothetical protein F5Y19DRAFT_84195 [Xylariaceae sp. FL1651]|nr:hypothetical protein F5Y19DRAFT_84195 [Xylariaceae sp. FL1651]